MKTLLISVLLFSVATLAQAQTASIGNVQLELGSSKEQVFLALQPRFALSPAKEGYIYNVHRRAPDSQPLGAALGSVEFEGLKLKRVVSKLGTLQGAEASAVMRKLVSAFADAGQEARAVSVETNIEETPEATTSWVYFRLPEKIVQMAVYEPKEKGVPVTVDITEQYALPD